MTTERRERTAVQTAFSKKVPDFPERVLLDISGKCNLRCPMCLVHADEHNAIARQAIGNMSFAETGQIVDQLAGTGALVQPNMWGEPLLTPDFEAHIRKMKQAGLAVAINTNGLTLKPETVEAMCEIGVDSLFVSIDADTPETLKKVRGIDKLDKIARNIHAALEVRGDRKLPRIGATFTIQADNRHELDDFVARWIKVVDVVRVGGVFAEGQLVGLKVPAVREPCQALYQTMPIHHDGSALICCWDAFAEHKMGNVLEEGIQAVWHGEAYNLMRHYHETGQWDKVPFCKDCNAWTGYLYEEEVKDGILIRRSHQFVYYNRLDRLESWTSNLRGHEAPGTLSKKDS